MFAGTVAIEVMGGRSIGFCAGRIDDDDGSDSVLLGPSPQQEERFPCPSPGSCTSPLGSTTVGLIYVNPEGPNGDRDPVGSASQVRDTFARMGFSDKLAVALIGTKTPHSQPAIPLSNLAQAAVILSAERTAHAQMAPVLIPPTTRPTLGLATALTACTPAALKAHGPRRRCSGTISTSKIS